MYFCFLDGGISLKLYKTLLFDLDDTLLDFGATEEEALHKLFTEQNMTLTPQIKAHYKKLNDRLWKAFELGEIEREQLVNTRFSILFKEYGLQVDGAALERKYREFLNEGHHLIDGAFELVKKLAEHPFDLYIVTNGDSFTQKKRLADSKLLPYFQDVFISDEVGFQKPKKEFFDHVFGRIAPFEKEQTLIIGDSLTSDITGGNGVGIDTCWINPNSKENHTEIVPTYEIQHIMELPKILKITL